MPYKPQDYISIVERTDSDFHRSPIILHKGGDMFYIVEFQTVLDVMDEFRRTHQDGRYPAGWCMKAITAIAARAAGCVSVLALAEMEEFCRTHQDIRLHPTDWCMRVLEAIVARAAGYGDRNSWTEVLKADTSSLYHRDLQNPEKSGF